MKKLGITALATLAVIATSCSNEDDFLANNPQNGERTVVLSAIVGDKQGDTRATLDIENSKAVFKWATGDRISVFTTADNDNNEAFTLSGGEGTKSGSFTGTLEGDETIGTLTYYPYNADHTTTTFTLPATYGATDEAYVENTHAAYRATIAEGSATFQPLAGMLCIKSKVPSGVNSLVLTATGKQITGEFTVETIDTEYVINTSADDDNSNSSVTYDFAASDVVRGMTFYVPLPAGTYDGFKIELKKDGAVQDSETKTYTDSKEIVKGKMYVLDELNHSDSDNMDYILTTENGVATYTVYTPAGLKAVNTLVNADLTANITLGADIILPAPTNPTTESNWTAIGKYKDNGFSDFYTGTFDGNNKIITGLVINSTENGQGLIGCLGENGIVRKLKLIDCTITSSGSFIGGIVGENEGGTIEECVVENISINSNLTGGQPCVGGIVGRNFYGSTVSDCKTYSSTIQSSGSMVGGIAGQNFHIIKDSEILNTESGTFSISGTNIVGGIVGNNEAGQNADEAKISNCHVKSVALDKITITGTGYNIGGLIGSSTQGIVENSSVSYCTVTGGGNQAGGLLGFNNGSVVSSCVVNNCVVTGNSRVGGIAGKNGYDTAHGREAIGIIIACFANNVNVSSTLGTSDGETPTNKSSVGGVVGINVSANTTGEIIGCYALNCTKDTDKDVLTDAANIIGYNAYKTETRYGTVTACHYYTSDTEISSVNAEGSETYTLGSETSWSAAATTMNDEIEAWNEENNHTCKYWDKSSPVFSVTKP